ncbi:LysR family transcriptional regulator [Companilactobacillus furfuricola]|uniref:LysR family transcriptional regulator n=1 Tax=Companilactobacillus furfuricola TaxID=1462575 RepID=UPI0013DDFB03|nr:LysR family transcriptional regulator [Companilactobacillus furfuricola]
MEINRLKTFLSVANNGSFKAAAEKLFLSPRAVSKQMDQIENELGVELFDRKKNSTHLNSTGKQFIVTAQDIVNTYNDALTKIQTSDQQETEKLRIGFSSLNQTIILENIVANFTKSHPHIQLELKEESGKRLLSLLQRQELDSAVTPFYNLTENHFDFENLNMLKLAEDELEVGVSRNNPLSNNDQIDLTEIKDMKILYYSSSESAYLKEVFLNKFGQYLAPEQISRVSSLEQRDMLVAANNGVGFYPSPFSSKEKVQNPMIKFLPITNDDVNKYYASALLYNKNEKNPSLLKLISSLDK